MIFWPQMYEGKEWQMWYDDSHRKRSSVGSVEGRQGNSGTFDFYYSEHDATSVDQMVPALLQIVEVDHPDMHLNIIDCDNPHSHHLCKGVSLPRLVFKRDSQGSGTVYEGPIDYYAVLHWVTQMRRSAVHQ
jgi:hypothetical protein